MGQGYPGPIPLSRLCSGCYTSFPGRVSKEMERGQEQPGPEEAPGSPVVVRKGFLEEVAAELSFEG